MNNENENLDKLLAASVNLIHNDLIKDQSGDHYAEFVDAILAASCRISLYEVSTAFEALENAADTLHRTPLLPVDTRIKLLEVAQSINLNRALRSIRD